MTTPKDEDLSSLFDNDNLGDSHGTGTNQETEQMLDQLCQEAECKQRWSRYQIVHDTLQRNLPPVIDPSFSSRVMAAIEAEPTVLSPPVTESDPSHKKKEPSKTDTSVSYISHFMTTKLNKNMGKRIAGLAVAASVTAVSVLSFQYNYQQQSKGQFDVAAAKNANMMAPPKILALDNTKRVAPSATPFSSVQGSVSNVSTLTRNTKTLPAIGVAKPSLGLTVKRRVPLHTNINMADPAISAQLHKYLINHSQNVSGTRLQGVMPYARIVTDSQMSALKKNNQQ